VLLLTEAALNAEAHEAVLAAVLEPLAPEDELLAADLAQSNTILEGQGGLSLEAGQGVGFAVLVVLPVALVIVDNLASGVGNQDANATLVPAVEVVVPSAVIEDVLVIDGAPVFLQLPGYLNLSNLAVPAGLDELLALGLGR
jgi:hypothetical protein